MASSMAIIESSQHACQVGVEDEEEIWRGYSLDVPLEESSIPSLSRLSPGSGSAANSPTLAAYNLHHLKHSPIAKGNDRTTLPSTMAVSIKLEAGANWPSSSPPAANSADGRPNPLTRGLSSASDNLQSLLSREMELDENFEHFYQRNHDDSASMAAAQIHGTIAAKLEPQPAIAFDRNCGANNANLQTDSVQVDIYRDLILRHLIQDIRSTCSKLSLPTDPMLWDCEDCVRWIEEMCTQFQLAVPPRAAYRHNLAAAAAGGGGGRALLAMSVDDFCACVGDDGGDTLHAQLQLWKTAFESYNISPKYCQPAALYPNSQITHSTVTCQYPLNILNGNTLSQEEFQEDNSAAHCQLLAPPGSHAAFAPPSFSSSSTSSASISSTNSLQTHHYNRSTAKMRKLNLDLQSFVSTNSAASKCKFANRTLSSPSEIDLSSNSSASVSSADLTEDDFCHFAQFEMAATTSNSQHSTFQQRRTDDTQLSANCQPRQISYSQQFAFFENTQKCHLPSQIMHHHSSNNAGHFAYTNSAFNAGEIRHDNLNLNFGEDFKASSIGCYSNAAHTVFVEANSTVFAGKNLTPPPPHATSAAAAAPAGGGASSSGGTIHLWHFIRELLDQPREYGACVRWVNRDEGTFKIESSHHLARFWGLRKNRSQMNYDKLSRSLRQYYKKGIIQKPEKKQRLVYKFLPPYNL